MCAYSYYNYTDYYIIGQAKWARHNRVSIEILIIYYYDYVAKFREVNVPTPAEAF